MYHLLNFAPFFTAGDEVEMIQDLGYFMSNHMKNEIYDSCKSVVNPTTSSPALSLMCGVWGDYCDADKLFAFIGNYSAI